MIKRVTKLIKQSSSWKLTSSHNFTHRHYQADTEGNFYRDGVIKDVKPDQKGNKFFLFIDDNHKRIRFKAHQIVLQTFEPEGLKDGLSIDHKDKNRLDNSLKNLRYATHKMQFENRDNTSYKIKKVKCINNGKIYCSCKEAENKLNLVFNTVARVARKERKSIHGYKFVFV